MIYISLETYTHNFVPSCHRCLSVATRSIEFLRIYKTLANGTDELIH
jgi:hypothetical protein